MSARTYVPVIHGAIPGRPDEADTLATSEAIRDALSRLGHRSALIRVGRDFPGAIGALAAGAPLAVFNMVEAIDGDASLAVGVPDALEARGLRHTGASGKGLAGDPFEDRDEDGDAGRGASDPAWSADGSGLGEGAAVIVKPDTEHGSVGIDAASVMPGPRAAAAIAARQARHGGRFFAEAYVEGREFNISVLGGPDGPVVLPAAEIEFSGLPAGRPRIVDYEAKWDAASAAYAGTPRRFAFPPADGALIARLGRLSLAAARLFGLDAYARVDFRVDARGEPHILEVNANPCLAPDAGFVAAAAEAGIGFDALIGRILALAIDAVPAR